MYRKKNREIHKEIDFSFIYEEADGLSNAIEAVNSGFRKVTKRDAFHRQKIFAPSMKKPLTNRAKSKYYRHAF